MSLYLQFENIAGIRSGEATIKEGINAVRSSNWQGKSSFLTAIETAMGTKSVLTEGEDRGAVRMETEDETIEVDLFRENGTVVRDGGAYLKSDQVQVYADLYACLDEENEVRRAVREGENLEEVLTRPLNFENIDEQIANLRRERDRLDSELDDVEDAVSELPSVERAINRLEEKLTELREQRKDYATDHTADVSERRKEWSTAIADRDQIENRIERLERTVERTEEKLAEKRAAIDDLEIPSANANLDAEISEIEQKLAEVQQDSDLLQSIYAPTKRLFEENRLDLITDVQRDLIADDVTCWTCGEETTREKLESRLEDLRERVTTYRSRADEYRERLEELKEHRAEFESAKQRKRSLERQIEDLKSTLRERQASLDSSRQQLAELEEQIDELSTAVEANDERITDIESEIKYTEARLEERQEEFESLEAQAARQESLREQREQVSEEITDLRTRKEAVKQRTRESFDDAINDVIERFDTGFESARLTSDFNLVVARDGREANLDALSDGEVELLGIVAALAGYEAFEMADRVSILLVDDLGRLADENVEQLIDYLQDRAEYLVFTAYPEHTSVERNTIDPTDWQIVSPQERS